MSAINPRYSKQPGGGGGASFPPGANPGDVLVWVGPGTQDVDWGSVTSANAVIGAVFDGADDVLEADRFVDLVVPYNCTIIGVQVLADQVGSFFYDIWKSDYATFPPTLADTITGGGASLIGVDKDKDYPAPVSWSTALLKDEILRFVISADAVDITKASIVLEVIK